MNLIRKIFFLVFATFSTPMFPEEEVKICLTMIVKNDEDVIWHCLSSVSDIVDCISIYDAGSTDNTVTLVEQFIQETKIPGKLHRNQHQNEERSRSFALQAARNMLEKQQATLSKSYLLVLDPWAKLEVDYT